MTAAPATSERREPRAHHYSFAHHVLPEVARRGPIEFALAMAGVDARERLERIWRDLGDSLAAAGRGAPLPAAGLDVWSFAILDRPLVLVRLPEPAAATECHFVAVVLDAMPTPDQVEGREAPPGMRCFTLEAAEPGSRTVLCEWNGEQHHIGYGDGPEAEPAAFVRAVEDLLGSRRASILAVAS